LQSHPVSDKSQPKPYVLKLYLYLFVAGVVTTLIAVRLAPLGLLVNIRYGETHDPEVLAEILKLSRLLSELRQRYH
jgi:hypothetical protein